MSGGRRRLALASGALAAALPALLLFAQPAPLAAAPLGVTTADDELNADGDCSLREAIVAANTDAPVDACPAGEGADTIALPAGSFRLTLEGRGEDAAATGDLDITGDLTIAGAGRGATIIDAGGDAAAAAPGVDRVIHVLGGAVAISGVTIRGGHLPGAASAAESGAGILNAGALTLGDSAVTGNYSPVRGGAILNLGALTVADSALTDNRSPTDGGDGGAGLANSGEATLLRTLVSNPGDNGIYNAGSLVVRESVVRGNTGGGGIRSSGSLLVERSTVSDNHNPFPGVGGGILSSGTTTISDSVISGNRGAQGGGMALFGEATVTGTTVSGNLAIGGPFEPRGGGGIYAEGALRLVNSTVSSNNSNFEGGGIAITGVLTLNNATIIWNSGTFGGGVSALTGPIPDIDPPDLPPAVRGSITAANSIIAANSDGSGRFPDCGGSLVSQGHNAISGLPGCAISGSGRGDLVGVELRIAALADNGGPTPTHALMPGSLLIDRGSRDPVGTPGACEPADQRGVSRPRDGDGAGGAACDIGAYEQAAPHPPRCMNDEATIVGTPGDDTIEGTPGRDVIAGLGGADTINGAGGDDLICGGAGNDSIRGGSGSDELLGEAGDDTLLGEEGDDNLSGGAGDDTLLGNNGADVLGGEDDRDGIEGGAGPDLLLGGRGDDRILGGDDDDRVEAGAGDDRVYGNAGDDFITAGAGHDRLFGEEGADRIYGSTGDDSVDGGPGADRLRGGDGVDIVWVPDAEDDVREFEKVVREPPL